MFEDLDLGHDHPAMPSTWTTLPNGWAKLRRDVDQGFGGRRATPSAVDARASLVGFTIGGRAGRGGSADLDVQVLSLAGLSVGRLPCCCDGFASSAACVLPPPTMQCRQCKAPGLNLVVPDVLDHHLRHMHRHFRPYREARPAYTRTRGRLWPAWGRPGPRRRGNANTNVRDPLR